MAIHEIRAKSLLRIRKRIDSWFVSHYGMNLYRGCGHNCGYCDGRAERYHTRGDFGEDVEVKVNAIELLTRELDPARRRKSLKRSFMTLGGGVGDCYQPAEETYRLSRAALRLLRDRGWPVLVLTKSALVARDFDILRQINSETRALVCISFSSLDDKKTAVFEPGVPPASKRLELLARCRKEEIPSGVFLMPVLPHISDSERDIEAAVTEASAAGAEFVIFGGLTLKSGRQRDHFFSILNRLHPELKGSYTRLYGEDRWGAPAGSYHDCLQERFAKIVIRRRIPSRMPPSLYFDLLDPTDRVVVVLEHIDYLLKLRRQSTPYGRAAYQISQLKEPITAYGDDLSTIGGVGPATGRLIREILETGRSSYYESLLF